MKEQVVISADPVCVALANEDRIRYFFDADPETIVVWHHREGFPIRWTGEGKGRRGYVPLREARQHLKRKAGL